MTNLFTNLKVIIAAGQVLSGSAERCQTLRVVSGRVWITVEGLPMDYWLFAGDSLTIPARRLIVVEADKTASCVQAQAPAKQHALAHLRIRFGNLLPRGVQRHDPVAIGASALTFNTDAPHYRSDSTARP
jgi:hypothetical protein